MSIQPDRLSRVLLRVDLAQLLAPTYAREDAVSEELALERMNEAIKIAAITERLYAVIADSLGALQGSRSDETLLEALTKSVPRRCKDMVAAPRGPAMSALTVFLNLELGLSPERLRASLESEPGSTLLQQGFSRMGEHLARQLLR